jgi:3-deoxy-D-manno-octulosonic-acid transferase
MSDVLSDAVLGAYRLAGRAAVPLLPLALSWRAKRGKEDRTRLGERFGRATLPRPAGRLAWVHAASVGETNAVMPLIRKLTEAGIAVVFTSVTVSSAGIAATRLPAGACHQFAPVDVAPLVGRFLDHWRPDLALFVESELWPTTIFKLSSSGIPQILVNARLSERSYRGWRRFSGIARSVFGRIPLCLAQSAQDAERYRALGAPRVVVTGNLKFDAPAPDVDASVLAGFRKAVSERPVWVAASTHEGEETIIAEAHRALRGQFPGLLTIIVPRHPARGDAIRASLGALGLNCVQRSLTEPIAEATDIYVADTFGELGLFYRLAPIAFLGGSLVPHGGQNPIEPLRLDCAVLHGPHVHNFSDIYAIIDAAGLPRIADAPSLATALASLLADPTTARRQAATMVNSLKPLSGALIATMAELDPYLRGDAGS